MSDDKENKHMELCINCISEREPIERYYEKHNDVSGIPIVHLICHLFEEDGKSIPKGIVENRLLIPTKEMREKILSNNSRCCDCFYYPLHVLIDSEGG